MLLPLINRSFGRSGREDDNIFHNNFKINNEVGIYKIVVVKAGVPTEIVIDDYIPVFADTNRPVFCKATGR